jgi:hypothetical protein
MAEEKNLWRSMILGLGLIWARSFRYGRENEVPTRELFALFNSPSDQLATVYHTLVTIGELEPIEKLAPELKAEIWEEAKAWSAPGASLERTKKVARSIWALNHLIVNYLEPQEKQ